MEHRMTKAEMVDAGVLPVYEIGEYLQPELLNDRGFSFVTETTTDLLDLIDLRFTTQEPWGRNIVTNDSLHRYQIVNRNLEGIDVFKATGTSAMIEASKIVGTDHYASGVLTTQHNAGLQLRNNEYCSVEMRLPKGKGFWSALWFLPAFKSWPMDFGGMVLPEVDAMEAPSLVESNSYEYYTNLHTYNEAEPVAGKSVLNDNAYKHVCPAEYDFGSDFHHFGCLRTEKYVYLTLNHKVINRVPMFLESIMQEPWMVLINLAIGGGWPGNPDATTRFEGNGLELRQFSIGEYDFVTEPTFDDTQEIFPSGNEDLIKDLDRLEERVNEKVWRAIGECFDERRDELR